MPWNCLLWRACAALTLALSCGWATATYETWNRLDAGGPGYSIQRLPPVEIIGRRNIGDERRTYLVVFGANMSVTGGMPRRDTGSSPGRSPGSPTPAEPGGDDPSPDETDDPAADDNSDTCPSTSNPVILSTGEKYKVERDFAAASSYGLNLQRTYRSYNDRPFMFGLRWSSEYDYRLYFSGCWYNGDYPGLCIPQVITMLLPDGTTYRYERVPQEYGGFAYRVQGAAATGRIIYSPYFYFKLTKNRQVYTFSTTGVIQGIATVGGATLLQYTYGANPREPIRIANGAGQQVAFTWSAGKVTKVTDPAGGAWNYVYNGNGMLASVTGPGSSPDIRAYHYEHAADPTLLTGISINGIRYSTYAYLANGRVSVSGLAGNEERDTFSYGANQTTVTSAAGQPTTYTFTSAQGALKLSSVSRAATATCAASAATTVYDVNGWIDYTLDWNGNKTDYTYDVSGQLLQMTVAAGSSAASTQINTWSAGQLSETKYRNASGQDYLKVTYSYVPTSSGVAQGKLASETWTDLRSLAARQTTYGYTFHANRMLATMTMTRVLPGGNATTTWTYDSAGNLTSVANPLGQRMTWSNHNGLGLPLRITDINGVATDYSYHPNGNLLSATQRLPTGDRVTTYVYNHDRQLTDVLHPGGQLERIRYTASGRAEYVGDAHGYVRTALTVTANDLTVSSTRHVPTLSGSTPVAAPSGQFSAKQKLDSLRRPLVDSGNSGQALTTTYDHNGNVKSVTDAAGRVTRYDYDARDRMIRKTAPDGGVTVLSFTADGHLAYVQDPRSLRTTYTYNAFGDVTRRVSPDTGTTSYVYDSGGRLQQETRNDGVAIGYTWDKLDRLTSRTSGTAVDAYHYDEGIYGEGRLTRVVDTVSQATYQYDASGALVRQVNDVYYGSTPRAGRTTWPAACPA
jgi:YD repeat-containing protein